MYRADAVAPGLWQGARPEGDLSRRFDVLVLCALEFQPRGHEVVVPTVVHAPMDDAWLTPREAKIAMDASRVAADAIERGKRVLSTCHMGLNRSGLVSALTLLRLRWTPEEAIAAIRHARGPNALTNPSFVDAIRRMRVADRAA